MYKNTILYGTAYYAEYMPYERIHTDMKMMKRAGINVIRIAESTWSTWEKQDGIFDFSILHQYFTGNPYPMPARNSDKSLF